MYELYPYFTNDGSVGLYSPSDDDIYHSTYGALTEAFEKFILPANINNFIENNSEIKILDICYGIGYNSKSFLEYFFACKKWCNDTIGTNNNSCNKIYIKAVDTDKNLIFLSPFFVTDKKIIKKDALSFKHEKISKLLKKGASKKYKLNKEINIILLKKIIENNKSIFFDEEFSEILKNKKYSQYFDRYMINLFKYYKNEGYSKTCKGCLSTFLHNIYYKYLSARHKKALKCLKLNDININIEIKDARRSLLEDDCTYNYVFLDAFTPAKCPSLWSLEFFKLLYTHLDNDGMVLTYSNSAAVRNGFIQAGFHVGKIFNPSSNKFIGTVATKNSSHIKHELSEYDLGLIKTKAGIIYTDKNLDASDEEILSEREKSVAASNLPSSSKYIKTHKEKK